MTRSFFVGEGQFGKVYTAVNNDTGVLMAMKEVTFSLTTLLNYLQDELLVLDIISKQIKANYFSSIS